MRSVLILFIFLNVFLSGSPAHAAAVKKEEDPQVLKIAAKHSMNKAVIFQIGKKRYCVVGGKQFLKKNYWFSIKGSVYYLNSKGIVQTGAFRYKRFHYYADDKGRLRTRYFININNNYRYYGSTGAMVTDGWYKADGHLRYFDKKGNMAENCWIEDHYVGWDGCINEHLSRSYAPGDPLSDPFGWVVKADNSKDRYLIIVGASRVVHMQLAVPKDESVIYIARSGAGYDWLKKYGLPRLEFWLSLYPKSKVVIQFGNNYLSRKDSYFLKYKALYKKLFRKHPKTRFYLMDILPGKASTNIIRNKIRQEFNKKLKKAFPNEYIGGYDYLVKYGYITVDSTHYDEETSRKIYHYILMKTKWKQK